VQDITRQGICKKYLQLRRRFEETIPFGISGANCGEGGGFKYTDGREGGDESGHGAETLGTS